MVDGGTPKFHHINMPLWPKELPLRTSIHQPKTPCYGVMAANGYLTTLSPHHTLFSAYHRRYGHFNFLTRLPSLLTQAQQFTGPFLIFTSPVVG